MLNKSFLAIVLVGLLWSVGSRAQEARGTILGRVTDSSGAVIPGASVKITNQSTGITSSLVTNGLLRPSAVPGTVGSEYVLPKSQRTVERWFNTAAGFERDTRRQLGFNQRALSFRFSGIRGDGINNWDLSVIKDTHISETMKLQFRGEFLNALNHALFSNPNTDPYSTAFGSITSEKAYPRRIQLGLKFIY